MTRELGVRSYGTGVMEPDSSPARPVGTAVIVTAVRDC